jgi:Zn-dependent M16 (insulinase) family peptidase
VVSEDADAAHLARYLEIESARPYEASSFKPFALAQPARQPETAWLANTQVNFCAKAFPAVGEAHADAPALAVLARYLTDGYLHPAIREKGGAYGAGAQFDVDSASFRFFSYRDPRLLATVTDFDRSLEWLTSHREAQRLEESILGVIRNLDQPRSPASAAIHAFYDELDGRTEAVQQAFREAVLGTSIEDVCRVAERYLNAPTAAIAVVTHGGMRADTDALNLNTAQF